MIASDGSSVGQGTVETAAARLDLRLSRGRIAFTGVLVDTAGNPVVGDRVTIKI